MKSFDFFRLEEQLKTARPKKKKKKKGEKSFDFKMSFY